MRPGEGPSSGQRSSVQLLDAVGKFSEEGSSHDVLDDGKLHWVLADTLKDPGELVDESDREHCVVLRVPIYRITDVRVCFGTNETCVTVVFLTRACVRAQREPRSRDARRKGHAGTRRDVLGSIHDAILARGSPNLRARNPTVTRRTRSSRRRTMHRNQVEDWAMAEPRDEVSSARAGRQRSDAR